MEHCSKPGPMGIRRRENILGNDHRGSKGGLGQQANEGYRTGVHQHITAKDCGEKLFVTLSDATSTTQCVFPGHGDCCLPGRLPGLHTKSLLWPKYSQRHELLGQMVNMLNNYS